jgi:carboxyl-terminal processing protease
MLLVMFCFGIDLNKKLNKLKMKKYFVLFLAIGLLFTNCKKNDDDITPTVATEDPVVEVEEVIKTVADYPVQDFMWQTLNAYYFWQADVPNLDDSKFEPEADYAEFLSLSEDPEEFLVNKLLFSEDRFTFYSEDYRDVTNFLAGKGNSNGLEFFLARPPEGGNKVIGVVRYIVKNSNASTKEIKRGDVFYAVNGVELFAETDENGITSSNLNLLDQDSYILNMTELVNDDLVPNGKEVELIKEKDFVEDPVLVSNVIEIGDKKIAYLMYNLFQAGSGENLNEVFGDFKSQNVTDLVLDLRYNSGGRGTTATILASLIYGTNTSELFFKTRYNSKLQEIFGNDTENNFVNTTGTLNGNSNSALNTLNLNKVYILATESSASASELVMVGLEPYVEVVHLGEVTVGKNQGSSTFVDDPENGNFYSPEREDQINPNNQWALQPIISKVENSAGFSDYSDGLLPDISFSETLRDLGSLGDPSEPFLARAIEEITGISGKTDLSNQIPMDMVTNSKMLDPRNSLLILDGSIPNILKKPLNSKTQ